MIKRINIIIAEDEPNIALALSAVITKGIKGSIVTVTKDGKEAWNSLMDSDSCQLIISDWNMPFITGAELLHKVRGNPKYKHLPFLMLTARSDKESVITAVKNGVTDYIAKPFENKNLVEKISKLLKIEEA